MFVEVIFNFNLYTLFKDILGAYEHFVNRGISLQEFKTTLKRPLHVSTEVCTLTIHCHP